MTTETLTIHVPFEAARRLQRVAEIAGRSVDDVAADALISALPTLLETVPERFRDELHAMEALGDQALLAELEAHLSPATTVRYDALLAANAASTLDDAGRQELGDLRDGADRLMFRRAYAALVLRWRGHRLAEPSESTAGG